jgi:hypothetical protein
MCGLTDPSLPSAVLMSGIERGRMVCGKSERLSQATNFQAPFGRDRIGRVLRQMVEQ